MINTCISYTCTVWHHFHVLHKRPHIKGKLFFPIWIALVLYTVIHNFFLPHCTKRVWHIFCCFQSSPLTSSSFNNTTSRTTVRSMVFANFLFYWDGFKYDWKIRKNDVVSRFFLLNRGVRIISAPLNILQRIKCANLKTRVLYIPQKYSSME